MTAKIFYLWLTAIAVLFPLVPARSQDSFFKGKVIQIIVGYPTGGGVDVEARLFGKYLSAIFRAIRL
jgi:tripartite-type tricarboxylate transporter receptor subunit TctC